MRKLKLILTISLILTCLIGYTQSIRPYVKLTLKDSIYTDSTSIYLDEYGLNNIDDLDTFKTINNAPIPSLYTLAGKTNTPVSSNTLQHDTNVTVYSIKLRYIIHSRVPSILKVEYVSTGVAVYLRQFNEAPRIDTLPNKTHIFNSITPLGIEDTTFTIELVINPLLINLKKLIIQKGSIVQNSDYVFISDLDGFRYDLFNIQGKLLLNGDVSSEPINMTSLPNGMYVLNINDRKRSIMTKKLIK